MKCICCMYGKATYIKVNQIDMILFTEYQGISGQVLIDFDVIFIILVWV